MPALHAGDGPMQDSTSCVNRCIYCHMLYQMFDANILYGTHQKKKNDADIWNVFLRYSLCCKSKASSANWKVSSENWKVSSKEVEGFHRRVLGSYTHKFPKRGGASLTDLLELCLCLPRCACNGKVEQQ